MKRILLMVLVVVASTVSGNENDDLEWRRSVLGQVHSIGVGVRQLWTAVAGEDAAGYFGGGGGGVSTGASAAGNNRRGGINGLQQRATSTNRNPAASAAVVDAAASIVSRARRQASLLAATSNSSSAGNETLVCSGFGVVDYSPAVQNLCSGRSCNITEMVCAGGSVVVRSSGGALAVSNVSDCVVSKLNCGGPVEVDLGAQFGSYQCRLERLRCPPGQSIVEPQAASPQQLASCEAQVGCGSDFRRYGFDFYGFECRQDELLCNGTAVPMSRLLQSNVSSDSALLAQLPNCSVASNTCTFANTAAAAFEQCPRIEVRCVGDPVTDDGCTLAQLPVQCPAAGSLEDGAVSCRISQLLCNGTLLDPAVDNVTVGGGGRYSLSECTIVQLACSFSNTTDAVPAPAADTTGAAYFGSSGDPLAAVSTGQVVVSSGGSLVTTLASLNASMLASTGQSLLPAGNETQQTQVINTNSSLGTNCRAVQLMCGGTSYAAGTYTGRLAGCAVTQLVCNTTGRQPSSLGQCALYEPVCNGTAACSVAASQGPCESLASCVGLLNTTSCQCPLDRLGDGCEQARALSCSLPLLSPPLRCQNPAYKSDDPDDGLLDGDRACLVFSLTELAALRFSLDCAFAAPLPLPTQLPPPAPYNFSYFVSSSQFSLSHPQNWTIRVKIFDFNVLSKSLEVLIPLSIAQMTGEEPVWFNVTLGSLPVEYFAGNRVYLELGWIEAPAALTSAQTMQRLFLDSPDVHQAGTQQAEIDTSTIPIIITVVVIFSVLTTGYIVSRVRRKKGC